MFVVALVVVLGLQVASVAALLGRPWGWLAVAVPLGALLVGPGQALAAGLAAGEETAPALRQEEERLAALTAFVSIALGAFFCVPAGWLADRHGKARIAAGAAYRISPASSARNRASRSCTVAGRVSSIGLTS